MHNARSSTLYLSIQCKATYPYPTRVHTLERWSFHNSDSQGSSYMLYYFSYQCKEWDCHAHTLLWEKCRKSIEICLVYLSSYPITFCNSAACFFRGNEWSRMNYFLLLLITLDFTGVLSLKVYLRLGKTGRSDPFGLKLCTRTFPRPRLL